MRSSTGHNHWPRQSAPPTVGRLPGGRFRAPRSEELQAMVVRSYRLAQHGVRRRRKLYNRLTRSRNPATILEWKRENQLDGTFSHQPRKK